MHLREGSYDAEILKEIKPAYGWMDVKGRVVMDIGACFGAATVHFIEQGAKHVVAIEPDKDNFRQLQKNTKGMPVTLINAAVTPIDTTVELFLNAGINTGGHSLHVTRGRESVMVQGQCFDRLLAAYKPHSLKIDCEGAEYDFLTKPLPKYVKQVAMEIHLNKKHWRTASYSRLVPLFDDWDVVKEPKVTDNNWHTLGGWRR